MEKPQIDFLKEKYELGRAKRSPFLFFVRPFVFLVVIAATVGVVFSYSTAPATQGNERPSFFSNIKQFVQSGERKLNGEQEDRVNILLLGVGGYGHEGPQLSDTIILASYQPSTEKIGLLSLPRDMTVPIPDYGYQKVNHANAYGELKGEGEGPILSKQVIGEVLNQDIQYFLRVDFDGFAEFVDNIGGLDVYVDQAFTDAEYPTVGKEMETCETNEVAPETSEPIPEPETTIEPASGETTEVASEKTTETIIASVPAPNYSCRFEILTFKQGWTHMDGTTALNYVRSRHGNNGQGSDFARSRRQQQILLAVKDKLLSASTFLNPSRITSMLGTLKKNISTNMSVWELARLASKLKNLQADQIVHHVIDASETSPLYATTLNGAYVLLPKNDDWKPLQTIASEVWTPDVEQTVIAKTESQKPTFTNIEIQNGTNLTGLAFSASQLLNGNGYDVMKIGNAATRGYKHTVIYDLTNGQRAEELKKLKEFLQADVMLSTTGWMISGDVVPKEVSISTEDYKNLATEPNIDFLVILGENSVSLVRN